MLTRRDCLRTGAALALGGSLARGAATAPKWTIGVFNRAWAAFDLDPTLKAARAAGFTSFGLVSPQKGDTFIDKGATPASIDEVKRKIADAGLDLVVSAIRFREDDPLDMLKDHVLRQVDNIARLGAKYVLTFGVDNPANFGKFEQVMAAAGKRAAESKMGMAIKPHGGISSGPAELLAFLDRVGQPNVSIWYDPGNIVYYTDGDPVGGYTPLAAKVTGVCAKDCAKPKGEVMISFGEGRVDFPALFARMAEAKFDGPILIEGVKVGPTPEETGANAKFNREVLEKALASLK